MSYAAEHPERVSHLILYDGAADPDEWRSTDWAKMEVAIRDQDWTLYTETTARVLKRGTKIEEMLDFAQYLRACVDQPTMRRMYDAREGYRVAPLLPHIASPTLVAASGRGMVPPVTASRRLASEIPNATYRHLEQELVALPAACIDFVLSKEQRPKAATASL